MGHHNLFALVIGAGALVAAGTAAAWSAHPPRDIEVGAEIDDALELGDLIVGEDMSGEGPEVAPPYQLYDHYKLFAWAGQRLEVMVASAEIDGALSVAHDGETVVEALGSVGGDEPARVRFTAPRDGDYYVRVSSGEAGQTGAYRLSVIEHPSCRCP